MDIQITTKMPRGKWYFTSENDGTMFGYTVLFGSSSNLFFDNVTFYRNISIAYGSAEGRKNFTLYKGNPKSNFLDVVDKLNYEPLCAFLNLDGSMYFTSLKKRDEAFEDETNRDNGAYHTEIRVYNYDYSNSSSRPFAPNYRQLIVSDTIYFIMYNNGSRYYFIPVFLEQYRDIYIPKATLITTRTKIIGESVDMNTISLNDSASRFYIYKKNISTLGVQSDNYYYKQTSILRPSELSNYIDAGSVVTMPTTPQTYSYTYYYKSYSDSTLNSKNYLYSIADPLTLSFSVVDDTTYSYEIVETNNTTKIYVGKELSDDFYTSFKVNKIPHNAYVTKPTETYQQTLVKEGVSYIRLKQSDTTFTFSYTWNNINFGQKTIQDNNRFIKLKNGNDKFALDLKKSYKIGETFSFDEIINRLYSNSYNSYLVYTDNSVVYLKNVKNYISSYVQNSNIPNNTVINETTQKTWNYVIYFESQYFGNFQYTTNAFIDDDTLTSINSAEIVNYKSRFNYNDILDFGDTAELHLKNMYGQDVLVVNKNDFNSYLNYDSKIGTQLNESSGLLTDNNIPIQCSLKSNPEIKIEYNVKVSYPSTLTVNTNKVVSPQYWEDGQSFNFDYAGLEVYVEYHDNSGETASITNDSISLDSINKNWGLLDTNVNSKSYRITLSFTYKNRNYSYNNFFITAEKIRVISLSYQAPTTDNDTSTIYWDSGENFKFPTGAKIYKNYNYKYGSVLITDFNELDYYSSSIKNASTKLTSESEITTAINTIYFNLKNDTTIDGYYAINFREDNISAVTLTNNVKIVLGNAIVKYKTSFSIQVSYLSNKVANNFENFSFVNSQEQILSEREIQIQISDHNIVKTFTLDSSKISFIKPKISSLELVLNGFKTAYNNKYDVIDSSSVNIKVYYEDSDYVGIANHYVYLSGGSFLTNESDFTISCDELPEFRFDGQSTINVEFPEGYTELSTNLVFKVLNRFDNSLIDNNTTQLGIKIYEVTEITGLKLKQIYNEYYVGENFLEPEKDNPNATLLSVFYNDANGTQKNIDVPLYSGLTGLNVYPIKGTKFNNPNSREEVTVSSAFNTAIYVKYSIEIKPKYKYSDNVITHKIVAAKVDNYTLPNEEVISNKYILVDENNTYVDESGRHFNNNVEISKIKVYGYLEDINDTSKNARIILLDDYIPPIDGQSNIKCKYPCYVPTNASNIDKCTIGHLFGNNNAKNRLFVSGNPDLPNCDWHSGAINTSKQEGDNANENGDFTYFEDTSYCFYGQTDNYIVGYDIISNDRMVVLKSKSDKESTIYYRTSGLIQAIDNSGSNVVGLNNEALYEESYPLVQGNIGAGALSNRGIINFNGDTLFISSDKEVDGLDVTGIIGDTQRYANTRSYYINQILKNYDLINAWFWTNNKYLFLILKDCVFLTHFETLNNNQYEWWKINVSDIQVMCEINDKIYFANSKGQIFLLNNGVYDDITKTFVNKGGSGVNLSADQNTDEFSIKTSIAQSLDETKVYKFRVIPTFNSEGDVVKENSIYYQVAFISNTDSGNVDLLIDTTNNALKLVARRNGVTDYDVYKKLENELSHKDTFYLNYVHTDDSGDIIGAESNSIFKNEYQPFKLSLIDDLDGIYLAMYRADTNERVDVSKLYYANLCKRLDDEYTIINLNKENSTFKLADRNGEPINLINFLNRNIENNFKAEINLYAPVKAYYITAPFTLGDLMYNKTIWAYTITNDTNMSSSIELCKATNNIDYEKMISLAKLTSIKGFDTEEMSFNKIDFERIVIPKKITFVRPILVPFICFGFRSNDNENAILCAIQIVYTRNEISVGKGFN